MFYIKQKHWDHILGYAEEAYDTLKTEIGGMSVCLQDKEGDWEIVEPVILKQEVTSGNCTLEKEELAKYYTRTAKKYKNKSFRFCWWHSHHTMAAFWSGTDLSAIEEFSDGDFSFALVVNLKGEYKFRVSVWNPVEAHEDVELEIVRNSKISKRITKEVADLCSKPVTTYTAGYSWNQRKWDPVNRKWSDKNDKLEKVSTLVSDKPVTITYYKLRDIIDNIITKVCDGSYTYKKYKESIEDVRKALETSNSSYDVGLLTENEVKAGELLHATADDMILDPQTKLPLYDDGWPHYDTIGHQSGWL